MWGSLRCIIAARGPSDGTQLAGDNGITSSKIEPILKFDFEQNSVLKLYVYFLFCIGTRSPGICSVADGFCHILEAKEVTSRTLQAPGSVNYVSWIGR